MKSEQFNHACACSMLIPRDNGLNIRYLHTVFTLTSGAGVDLCDGVP